MVKQEDIKFFSVALFVVLIDQLIKIIIRNSVSVNQIIIIIPNIFSIIHTANTGITFGMLKGYNSLLIWIYLIIIGIILYYFSSMEKEIKIPMALVLGAVTGNLLDRIFLGAVTDFIKISLWPAFNIADLSASIGIILMIVYLWKKK